MRSSALASRKVLVTGASSGIGRACALAFAHEGANVLATAPAGTGLESLPPAGPSLHPISILAGDLTDDRFVGELCASANDAEIVVQSAGVAVISPFLESRPQDWDLMFAVNVRALLGISFQLGKAMASRGRGHMILISSAMAHAVYPNSLVYAATKHAVSAIHQGLRLELGPRGVRSTELRPGLVGDTRARDSSTHPDVVEGFKRRPYTPIQSEDIARAAIYAASSPDGVDIDVLEVKPVGQP